MENNLSSIGYKLRFGIPTSLDETRWLYTQLTGETFPYRTRCTLCEGEGRRAGITCAGCRGSGYQTKDDS